MGKVRTQGNRSGGPAALNQQDQAAWRRFASGAAEVADACSKWQTSQLIDRIMESRHRTESFGNRCRKQEGVECFENARPPSLQSRSVLRKQVHRPEKGQGHALGFFTGGKPLAMPSSTSNGSEPPGERAGARAGIASSNRLADGHAVRKRLRVRQKSKSHGPIGYCEMTRNLNSRYRAMFLKAKRESER